MPGSGGVAHRTPDHLPTKRSLLALLAGVAGVAFATVLLAVWLLADPRTPDLAAAAYRLNLFQHLGPAIYDEHWYAGHDLPGYSLLFPPLAWLLGLRVVAALSVLCSVALFERLTVGLYGPCARWAACAFALAAVGDIWIGRVAFALGVSFALAATLALVRGRPLAAGALAVLCAAASPVAGVLLALAGLSAALWRRSPRELLAIVLPVAIVLVPLTLLFPEGGSEPFPIVSFAATVLVAAAFIWALPAGQSLLRFGGLVYLLACLLCLIVPTAMGSNVERYGVLLAGPLLLCAVLAGSAEAAEGNDTEDARDGAGGARDGADGWRPAIGRRFTPAVAVALGLWALWAGWGPLRETLAVAGNESTSSAYYAPVELFLDAHARGPVRIEVPLTRSHWETAELAPRVSLARGWEKQLDTRFDHVLLSSGLNARGYAHWLHEQAVSYVALPDTKLDPSSAREGDLIRGGLPYLREVFAADHWRIYEVRAATPIASGPGRLISLGHDSFALSVRSPGSFMVRVRYTRYWSVAHGSGCVRAAPGGWTSVLARAPGTLVVQARFSLNRAFGLGSACGSY